MNKTIRISIALLATVLTLACASASALAAPVWDVQSVAQPSSFQASDTVDAAQSIRVGASEGTFTLSFTGLAATPLATQTTASLAYDASTAQVQSALEELADIGAGNVSVSGGPGDAAGENPYVVTFDGSLSGATVAQLTASSASLTPGAGTTLSCTGGPGTAESVTYEWLRDGMAIPGATAGSYTLTGEDAEKSIQCRVLAANSNAGSVEASTPSVTIPPAPGTAVPQPPTTGIPAITPATAIGGTSTLTCSSGTWVGSPTFAYQWLRNGLAIAGATASTYKPTAAEAKSAAYQCEVIGTNPGGATVGVSPVKTFLSDAPSPLEPVATAALAPLASVTAITSASSNDRYLIQPENIGSSASAGTVTVTDHLPTGVRTTGTPFDEGAASGSSSQWTCSGGAGQSVVTCTSTSAYRAASSIYHEPPGNIAGQPHPIAIPVAVSGLAAGALTNRVEVSGGEAATTATAVISNPVNTPLASPFGLAYLQTSMIGAEGTTYTQAGGHPYALTVNAGDQVQVAPGSSNDALTVASSLNDYTFVGSRPRTYVTDLPLGLIGDPQAAPRCPLEDLAAGQNLSNCPPDTQVGNVYVDEPGEIEGPYSLFNLQPEAGEAAQFGFSLEGVVIVLDGTVVHTPQGYVLRVTANLVNVVGHNVMGFSITFYGDPAKVFAPTFSSAEAQAARETPFLTAPVNCGAGEAARTMTLHADSWAAPAADDVDPLTVSDFSEPQWGLAAALFPAFGGCEALAFSPSLSLQPASASEGGTTRADEPSGYDVNLRVSQSESYNELATPELKTATVTLPVGVSVSPSAANGLEACGDAQIDLESSGPGSCPLGSQIGVVRITTPLLEEALEGEVLLGQPECSPCTEVDAREGRIFRLFLQVHSEKLGVTIKLAGSVRADPATGQLTATFAENPQLPFSDLELKFKDGERAPLANPQTCGTFTTSSTLTAWSEPATAPVVSSSPFEITGCGALLPFSPGFAAGMASPVAGAASSFSVSFSRGDGEQDLGGITVNTPPGLLGRIAGVAQCGEAEANAGSCSGASEIGTTTVSAGPGSNPYTITGGRVYLTGPYQGQPFGLSIVVPAVAGPFNLGNVVVRASIAVNPTTAQLTITSGALPQIVDGVPIRLRTVNVEVNRPGFMFNATNCTQQSIAAGISGEHPIGSGEANQGSVKSSPYAASGCADLPFKPVLSASTQGRASKAGGASLVVKISQKAGEANIHRVDLTLPVALPARLTTLQKACTEAQFNADPAGCPAASVIGTARALTPVLNVVLTGPGYLVSHGGAAFPDVEFVLQGEGVKIVLDGGTDIKKGVTYSRFETVPDAPISSFEATLPEGPHSILGTNIPTSAKYDLCGQALKMPTTIAGQNGAQATQTTKILVTGCPKAKKSALTRAQKLKKALKACRKDKKKAKRAKCEKQAHKKYGPIKKTKKKTNNNKKKK